jgi:hypothetical protein
LKLPRLMRAWADHERIALRTTQIYQEGIGGRCSDTVSAEVREEMEARVEFYSDVVFIENQLDVELPIPQEMDHQDVAAVATVAEILRTGTGTATFQNINVHEVNPSLIPRLIDDIAKQSPARRVVSYEIFGRQTILGEGDYELPQLKIIDIIPHGTGPTAPARVVIGADGTDQISFTLVQ